MKELLEKFFWVLSNKSARLKFVAVFLLAVFLRAVPEFLSGKYPVGFDSISGYIPAVLALPDVSPMVLFGWVYSPLAIFVLWFIRFVTGLDVYLLLKIAAPVFYGLFNVCFCYMLSRGMGWSDKKSFVVSVILLLQPAIMRMGWDQLREELGLMFLFLLLGTTKMDLIKGAKNKPVIVAALSILIVISHQLAAILLFVAALYQIINATIKKQKETLHTITTIIPAATIFTWQLYMTHFTKTNFSQYFMPLQLPRGSSSFIFTNYFLSDPRFIGGDYWTVLSYVICLALYTIVPLIPFAIKGIFKDRAFTPIAIWLLVASFSIVVYPWYALAEYWWWILLLPIPLTVFAGEGLDKLRMFSSLKKSKIMYVGIALLGIVSFSYASSAIQIGYPYAFYYIPSSLVESSVPIEDIPDITKALQWTNEHVAENTTVIVPEKLQGLAILEIKNLKIRVAPAILPLSKIIELNKEKISMPIIAIYDELNSENHNQSVLVSFGKINVYLISD